MCVLMFKSSHRPDEKVADVLALTHACTTVNAWSTTASMLQRTSKVPIVPMGKLLTHLPQLTLPLLWPTLRSTTVCTCRRDLKLSHRPDGRFTFARCMQGGGVNVWVGGTVSIVNSQIYSNTAANVRARVRNFPSPPWETHVLIDVCREAVSMSALPAVSQ